MHVLADPGRARLVMGELDRLIQAVLPEPLTPFHGLGFIVAEYGASLPVFQLPAGRTDRAAVGESLHRRLARFASAPGSLHDGFHILSPDMSLLVASCYVAAPVPAGNFNTESLDDMKDCIGSRWITALFASRLPGVLCTSVVNSRRAASYFAGGRWLKNA